MIVGTLVLALLPSMQDPAPAAATRQREPAAVTVRMGGLVGRVVRQEGDTVRIEFVGRDGHAEMPVHLLPAEKRYQLRRAEIDESDAEAWLGLAEFAGQNGLQVRRIEALQRAAELAPELSLGDRIAQARQACGQDRLQRAREQREAGDLEAAIRTLRAMTGKDADLCPAVEDARAMLEDIRANLEQERQRATEVRQQRQAVRQQDEALSEIQRLATAGDEAMQKGLANMGDYVEAKDAFSRALALYGEAHDRVVEIEAEQDATLPEPIRRERKRMRRDLEDDLVRAHVQLGHVYVARGDETAAYQHAGRAAAIDPDNAAVARLRTAIGARGR